MEGRLILALLVCLTSTEYGLGREIVTREINCPSACTKEYAPVCGSDGKTYGNECQLNVTDCESEEDITKVHDGPCIIALLKELKCRRKFCTLEYAPVCGSDGKTYSNKCDLNGAACESEEGIRKVHDGPCGVACPLIGCINPCPFGYIPDAKGCPTCQCKFIALLKELKCRRKFCTLEYAPVCGSDGKTYSNKCMLNAADCLSEEDITKVHDGPCGLVVACPLIGCLNPCPFGYIPDAKGCPTCLCKKPFCPKPCNKLKDPVCGSDGKTYSNECVLENADCLSEEDITKVHHGPCQPNCPKGCPKIYAPVCGSDGKTHSNECELENADCLSEEDITKVHNGPCINPKCPVFCPSIYAPVCGSNGKTYVSECTLEGIACHIGEDITKVHDGACSR